MRVYFGVLVDILRYKTVTVRLQCLSYHRCCHLGGGFITPGLPAIAVVHLAGKLVQISLLKAQQSARKAYKTCLILLLLYKYPQ